jgi:hypothetical protein
LLFFTPRYDLIRPKFRALCNPKKTKGVEEIEWILRKLSEACPDFLPRSAPDGDLLYCPIATMATNPKSSPVAFDRRQVFRPFIERLNPIASPHSLELHNLIVPRDHDPRDPGQPPIHMAFAEAAELNRGTQMALVGGIGSGKTTELRLTHKVLRRHADAVNIYVDLADYTDLTELNTGAILATAGMMLYSELKKRSKELPDQARAAYDSLHKLAFPRHAGS